MGPRSRRDQRSARTGGAVLTYCTRCGAQAEGSCCQGYELVGADDLMVDDGSALACPVRDCRWKRDLSGIHDKNVQKLARLHFANHLVWHAENPQSLPPLVRQGAVEAVPVPLTEGGPRPGVYTLLVVLGSLSADSRRDVIELLRETAAPALLRHLEHVYMTREAKDRLAAELAELAP